MIGSDTRVELATGQLDAIALVEQMPLTEVVAGNPWESMMVKGKNVFAKS